VDDRAAPRPQPFQAIVETPLAGRLYLKHRNLHMAKKAVSAKKSKRTTTSGTPVEKLKQKIVLLEAENSELKIELEQYIEKWETLDGDAVKVLIYLSRHKTCAAKEVARANGVNVQIADSYLKFLADHHYVRAPGGSGRSYVIAHKGVRYLEERGLLE
jgi:predicted transcriptional regulator